MSTVDERYIRAVPAIQRQLQTKLPLLWQGNVDRTDPHALPRLLGSFSFEVVEALKAREAWESESDPQKRAALLEKLADEHNDMLVFCASIVAAANTQLQYKYNANGDGGHSTIYDRLAELSGELADKNALEQVIALLHSADFHLPVPYAAITSLKQTLDKVLGNYPSVLMQTTDENGKQLTEEGRRAKRAVVFPGLRMIRDFVNQQEGERPLKVADWKPFHRIIGLGYQHPQAALQVIYSELTMKHSSAPNDLVLQMLPAPQILRPVAVQAKHHL